MTEFIEADEDAAKLFTKVRDLGISDDEVVSKLIESGILTQNLAVAITAAERNNAIREFEQAIDTKKQNRSGRIGLLKTNGCLVQSTSTFCRRERLIPTISLTT